MTSKVIGSNPIGEANAKNFLSDNDDFSPTRRVDAENATSPTSVEYVKRTALLFEKLRISNESGAKPAESAMGNGDAGKDVPDFAKKPSYLGVSCSNSGYRNVIKYDSKLREGLWSSTNQRESLVLSNHRLRDSSPMKFDQDFRSQNGHETRSMRTAVATTTSTATGTTTTTTVSSGSSTRGDVNGFRTEEFVNISTSTKTISTFRDKEEPVRNGRGEETWRRSTSSTSSYSSLGISPKILKSPEKNCNSFLRSINSFESNCKKSQSESVKTSCYRRIRSENVADSPRNSVQQRIEWLYGPSAVAQGLYVQSPKPKPRLKPETSEGSVTERLSESTSQNGKFPLESIPDLLPAAREVVIPIQTVPEQYTNGEAVNGSLNGEPSDEKNGHYYLKLLEKETNKLESLASLAESELENGENLPEEVCGKLRAAAGKARLLVRQKMQQFEGLCQKNLNEKPGELFPTRSEDLAGFWDMVMLQVVQVYDVFDEIDKLKKNNWKPVAPNEDQTNPELITTPDSTKKTARKSSTPTPKSGEKSEKAEMAKKAREESRKKLMEERRKKMKELRENKTVSNDNEIEIFAK